MKRKGFTLIELVVVVAIILLLAATLAPKLRKEVAKARDAKAVAALGSLRTAVNIFYSDKGSIPTKLAGTSDDGVSIFAIDSKTSEYLEKDLVTFLNTDDASTDGTARVPVGASRDEDSADSLVYGGYGVYSYTTGDDLEVILAGVDPSAKDGSGANELDTKSNNWASY